MTRITRMLVYAADDLYEYAVRQHYKNPCNLCNLFSTMVLNHGSFLNCTDYSNARVCGR